MPRAQFFSECPLPFPASFHQSINIKNKRRHFSGHPPSLFLFLPQCPAPLPSPPIHRQRPFPVLYWMRSRSGINPCVSRRHHVRALLPPRPSFLSPLSLVCLVCLLLLPACPAPGSDLDGTAHNHHAQIRAGDAYSNIYGVMAYGDSARARYGTVVNDGGQAVQTFGGCCRRRRRHRLQQHRRQWRPHQ